MYDVEAQRSKMRKDHRTKEELIKENDNNEVEEAEEMSYVAVLAQRGRRACELQGRATTRLSQL